MSELFTPKEFNLELGDDLSSLLYEASRQTRENRPGLVDDYHDSFFSLRGIKLSYFKNCNDLCIDQFPDGVGTKIEIAERVGDHSTIATDLFAMVCDDAVACGYEPIAVATILDVNQLDEEQTTKDTIRQLSSGYIEAARQAGVVITKGESATLGDRVGGYGDFNVNWGAVAIAVAHKKRMLSGEKIALGDHLVGLQEFGFRSNGFTLIRDVLLESFGPNWHEKIFRAAGAITLGKLVLKPSIIYTKLINELTGGYDIDKEPKAVIHGIAHITGGGQPGKLGRMLTPSGNGVFIDEPIEPPNIMSFVQEKGNISDEKAHKSWNMGTGMVIATPEPDKVIEEAERFGIHAKEIGIVRDNPQIKIRNLGVQSSKKWLTFKNDSGRSHNIPATLTS